MSGNGQIKKVLADLIDGYRTLLELLQRERACLVAFDVSGMEILSKEKDTLLIRLRLLEEEKLRRIKGFRKGGGAGKAPVEEPAQWLHTEMADDGELENLRLRLVSLLQSVEELNGFNRLLMDRSLATIRSGARCLASMGVGVSAGGAGSLFSRET